MTYSLGKRFNSIRFLPASPNVYKAMNNIFVKPILAPRHNRCRMFGVYGEIRLHRPLNVLLAAGSLGIHSQPHLGCDLGVELNLRDVLPDLADLRDLHQPLVHVPVKL